MKIAVIAYPVDEQYAGIHVYAMEFVRALERNNRDHTLVYVHRKKNPFFQGMREIILPLRWNLPLCAPVHKLLWTPRALSGRGFDLVHDLFHVAAFTFLPGPYRKVVTIHDITPILFPTWHIRVSTLTHRMILPLLFRRADLVLTDSESTKHDVAGRYHVRGRIESVLLGQRSGVRPVDRTSAQALLRARYGIPADFILHVGTHEPRKNLGFLLEIFETLKREGLFPGSLVLVGRKGWHARELESRIASMGPEVRKDIVLPGYVPEEDLSRFYSAASVFAYPSFYEGFGLPPLEAMGCGCPTLAADTSSLREVVGGGGLLLPLGRKEVWVETIRRVLGDKPFREGLMESGRRQAARFSWDEHARRVLALYEEIR